MKFRDLSKKNKLLLIIGIAALVLILLAVLALDARLKIKKYDIESEKIENKIRIALVTDLHSCKYGKDQKTLISALEGQAPDVVLLGGDIFDDELSDENAEKFISAISEKYPCYYVTGNHEWMCTDESFLSKLTFLEENGVKILRGESEILEINGEKINICGIDDPSLRMLDGYNRLDTPSARTVDGKGDYDWFGKLDSLDEIAQNGNYTLLLSHRPECFEKYAGYDFDLVLSGHAHGGQWRVPLLINGVWAPNQGFLPEYAGGRYESDGTAMIVSRGLARESTFVPRVFNRPELVIIDIE